ncbi:MAG: SoxR reducing system RseC family protein [Candidatus Riflebacteria bacterium]|nr:SoxR reducing system RseC family protein [Candidatus Riflebacteria bacterium]
MSLHGKVIRVETGHAIVEVSPRPECQGCNACKGLLGDKPEELKQIKVLKAGFILEAGDEVIVDLNPGEESIAAILVFGAPVAGFFAGLFMTPYICELGGLQTSDIITVICGFGGMAIAFALLAIFSRSRFADKLTMKVVKKL